MFVVPNIVCGTRAIEEEDVSRNSGVGRKHPIGEANNSVQVEFLEKLLLDTQAHTITEKNAVRNVTSLIGGDIACRRQIEKSPLAQIEMSLSTVSVGEYWADDGDCGEPDGDRPDERVARSGGWQDQRSPRHRR